MQTKYIDIQGKWGIVLCYDLDKYDEDEARQSMTAFGVRDWKTDEAMDIRLHHYNTGMCISREDIRMSLIFIGNATSEEQWWDTVSHELFHTQQAILNYYNVPNDTEDAAWTMGYLMRKAVMMVGEPCYV